MADSRYRITERVAAGGMAEVFRGVAESLQGFRKNIAIKRILPNLTKNKKFVAMFLDEARLSLALQHANIVQVFDIGHSDDTYFIVMEYVDGVPLKALMEWRRRIGRRIPIANTLHIIMEMCKGLSYAHELLNPDTGKPLGIVHRDISPPNVLISKQGEIKVVDFGLAKATSQLENTDPGVVKGKMSYLSPEAARGEEVDHRADIFAVGILLYEMLTGKRLFYGETDYQTVELVRNAKIPPLKAQNPQVETELEDIVRKSLARRAEDRYQSALDLQDALAHYSYSRGLKVISRDIAELVRQCLDDLHVQSGEGKKSGSIINTLLNEEIVKFTSVDFEEAGARPLSEDDLSPPPPFHTGEFIDPRVWSTERLTPVIGLHEVPDFDARPTTKDGDAVASVAAQAARQTARGSRPPAAAGRAPAPEPSPFAEPNAPTLAESPPTEPTPGPESLAAVLEPPAPRAGGAAPSRAARSFLIGVAVGVVLLGGVVAALIARKNAGHAAPAVNQPPPAAAEVPATSPPSRSANQ
ncbi:MAG TPA: serine/threonine-protein kinase [Polyangia bacterium]|nr:serine/threonine-protein kinase [Polyangia bacterium]